MASPKKNAIELRLEVIEGLWNEFAEDKEARVCRWLVDEDEVRMVEAFVECQNEAGGQVPDLFVVFEDSFADLNSHGLTLSASLRTKYEEIRDALGKEGINGDWRCPALNPGEPDTAAFVRCCVSFQAYYQSILKNVVVVLRPQSIANSRNWQDWLAKLVRSGLPTAIRVLVVDLVSAPVLKELAEALPAEVKTIQPDLDMPAAYLELARGTGKMNPGTSFRLNFVALTQAAAKGDLGAVKKRAASALAIAQEHGWPQMQIVVHMALAATLLGAKQTAQAIDSYRAAGTIAATAAGNGDAAAPKLVLQARLGEASALLSDARHAEAARVYEEAAAIAQKNEDHLLTMEGWRMAAYCHEQCKEVEPGFRCGNLALDAAERLDPEMRANSTLPYVGQGLLRLFQPKGRIFRRVSHEDEERAEQVRARMTRLAGPDWEKKLEPEKAKV